MLVHVFKLEAEWMEMFDEVSTLSFNGLVCNIAPLFVVFILNALVVHFMCSNFLGGRCTLSGQGDKGGVDMCALVT